jgi:hypothetical protein
MKTVKGTAKLVMARYSVRRKACAPSLIALWISAAFLACVGAPHQ